MRLKDVLALPKDVNSLQLLQTFLNQPLDYADHMAAFLHYIDILHDVKSYDLLLSESEQLIQRYKHQSYDDAIDRVLEVIIHVYLELNQPKDAKMYLDMREDKLPVLSKHRVYLQLLTYKKMMQAPVLEWLESIIYEDLPKETFIRLAEALLDAYIQAHMFDEALVVFELTDQVFPEAFIIKKCEVYEGLKQFQNIIDLIKPIVDKSPKPEYLFYLMKAYINTNQNQRAINLEVEYESVFEQTSHDFKFKFYTFMMDFYKRIDNSISVKLYQAHLNRLQAKSKKQPLTKPESKPTLESKQVQVTLTKEVKKASLESIEKLHTWFEKQLFSQEALQQRDNYRTQFILLNQLIPFDTLVMYEKHRHMLYFFKKERLYDKRLKKQELESSLLQFGIEKGLDGFIDPNVFANYKDVVTQQPYAEEKQLYVYQTDQVLIMYYFKQPASVYAEHDDLLRIISLSLFKRYQFEETMQQQVIQSELFNKFLEHPQVVARVYYQGICTYSKAAKRWMHTEDDEPIEPFIKRMNEKDRVSYKDAFRALYNYEEPSKVFDYQFDQRHIQEFASVHVFQEQPLILSIFKDSTPHEKAIEEVKAASQVDLITGLHNLQALYDMLPSMLSNKVSILKIELNKNVSYLYGQKSYLNYFKEFGFLTKKLIPDSDVFVYDANHLIVTMPYNDIRAVQSIIKKYMDACHEWDSKTIPQEPFLPYIGIIRYPVVTNEKNIETLLHYLDIALHQGHANNDQMYFFKYQDYEQDVFEQNILNQIHEAINHETIQIGFNQIIDQQANKVWMYESFAYIPTLDVHSKDIQLIAKKRKRTYSLDMSHLKQVMKMLSDMYQKTGKYIKILVPMDKETLTNHAFIFEVAHLFKTFQIPPKIIDINLVGDLKANVHLQVMSDLKAMGIGIHTSSLKVALYYDVDALHFDIKHPDAKMTTYLTQIKSWTHLQNIAFVLRDIKSKDIKQLLHKHDLMLIEGPIYKQLTKDALFSKILSNS